MHNLVIAITTIATVTKVERIKKRKNSRLTEGPCEHEPKDKGAKPKCINPVGQFHV